MATWMSYASATFRHESMAAGVVPQSSWSFRPQAPARTWSIEELRAGCCSPCPGTPVHRQPLGRLEHPLDVPGARRAGRRPGAGRRAGAAADHGGDARGDGHLDLLRDRSCGCGCRGPPAVQIIPSPEITSVPGPITSRGSTPGWISGLPACRCRRSCRRGCRCRP